MKRRNPINKISAYVDGDTIPFNQPYLSERSSFFIQQVLKTGKTSGNGIFTQKCQAFFEETYGFNKALLTTSGTDALEMCTLLADIQIGDEVIAPSFTFSSTANAFLLRGAKIVFIDSEAAHPNMDIDQILPLINEKTKVVVAVHYGGTSANIVKLRELCDANNLILIEDAAHALDAYHDDRPIGSIGHVSAFSFHESKNIQCGEGGMLVVNDPNLIDRAEIIWEKGTNKVKFNKGEIDYYKWVDIGSSFLPSEIVAALLWSQIEHLSFIQNARKKHWSYYAESLAPLVEKGFIVFPEFPKYSSQNAHLFYFFCKNLTERNGLSEYLKKKKIAAYSHYYSLHNSPFFKPKHDGRELPNADRFTDTLIRLPLHVHLSDAIIDKIVSEISEFYNQ